MVLFLNVFFLNVGRDAHSTQLVADGLNLSLKAK